MSLKLLFDLNGLVFFATPVVGGCKGLPVSFWTGAERSTSGCRPRPAWSTELALETRGCAYCGVLEKLEFVGTLRADAVGEAERATDIAEPGLRGGRRFDSGISSSLLCDESFSLVSVSAMASLSLGRVGGTNDPREKDDGRPVPATLVRGTGARKPKQKWSQYLSFHWIVRTTHHHAPAHSYSHWAAAAPDLVSPSTHAPAQILLFHGHWNHLNLSSRHLHS